MIRRELISRPARPHNRTQAVIGAALEGRTHAPRYHGQCDRGPRRAVRERTKTQNTKEKKT